MFFCFILNLHSENDLASALPAPTGLAITNIPFGSFTATSVTIKWTPSEVTNTYDVEVRYLLNFIVGSDIIV